MFRISCILFILILGLDQLTSSIATALPSSRSVSIQPLSIQPLSIQPVASSSFWLAQRRPSRRLGSRGGVCAVSPGLLEQENVIWSDRPLFLWQADATAITMKRLQVIDSEGRILWEAPLAAADQSAIYQGKPLQPGQFYKWRLEWTVQGTEYSLDYSFKVMDGDRRNEITQELQALLQRLQTNGETAEGIASHEADYFLQQPEELWSDALNALYTVKNPSPATTQKIQNWVNSACNEAEG